MKRILSLLIFLIFQNCSDKNKAESVERNAFIFYSENPKEEIFDFKNEENKGFVTYKYVSKIDSSKIVYFNFTKENKLSLGPQEFILEKRDPVSFQELPDLKFNFYQMKNPVTDGTGPILFNEQYGVLGIYNSFGPRIIFLKDSNKKLSVEVLKALQE